MTKNSPNLEVILGPLPALSCVELGVVIRAARAAWERAGSLPKRREVLERLLRGVTPGELEAGWSALLAQLIDAGDEYTWPAVKTAWEEARAVERRRSRAARAGAEARWGEGRDPPPADAIRMRIASESHANRIPSPAPPPEERSRSKRSRSMEISERSPEPSGEKNGEQTAEERAVGEYVYSAAERMLRQASWPWWGDAGQQRLSEPTIAQILARLPRTVEGLRRVWFALRRADDLRHEPDAQANPVGRVIACLGMAKSGGAPWALDLFAQKAWEEHFNARHRDLVRAAAQTAVLRLKLVRGQEEAGA